MSDYTSIGFDSFLSRPIIELARESNLDSLASEEFLQDIPASKIVQGTMKSPDGNISLSLETGTFIVSDGVVERVRLGKLTDGTIGLIIKDKNNNILVNISGDKNLLQSPTTNLQVDFDEERILVKDTGGTPRVLIGKGDF